jgi:hypothetical protein
MQWSKHSLFQQRDICTSRLTFFGAHFGSYDHDLRKGGNSFVLTSLKATSKEILADGRARRSRREKTSSYIDALIVDVERLGLRPEVERHCSLHPERRSRCDAIMELNFIGTFNPEKPWTGLVIRAVINTNTNESNSITSTRDKRSIIVVKIVVCSLSSDTLQEKKRNPLLPFCSIHKLLSTWFVLQQARGLMWQVVSISVHFSYCQRRIIVEILDRDIDGKFPAFMPDKIPIMQERKRKRKFNGSRTRFQNVNIVWRNWDTIEYATWNRAKDLSLTQRPGHGRASRLYEHDDTGQVSSVILSNDLIHVKLTAYPDTCGWDGPVWQTAAWRHLAHRRHRAGHHASWHPLPRIRRNHCRFRGCVDGSIWRLRCESSHPELEPLLFAQAVHPESSQTTCRAPTRLAKRTNWRK